MFVREIMTRDVVTVSPDTSLKEAGKMLKEKKISGIPVVDDIGNIVGIITITDILKMLQEIHQWQEIERSATRLSVSDLIGKESLNTKVKNVMTKNVYTLDENSNISDVMQLMFTKKIHTIPVMKDNKLAGIIGKRDLIYASF